MLNDLPLMDLRSFSFLPFFFFTLFLMSSFLGTFFLSAVPGSLQSFLPSCEWGISEWGFLSVRGLQHKGHPQHLGGDSFPQHLN